MKNANREPSSELKETLLELEDRLETPVVPGEMQQWCREVQSAFERLRNLYEGPVRSAHKRQLAEIRREDPGLDTRVTQMAEEDAAIVLELERLGSLLSVLASHVDPQAESVDDAGTDEQLSELTGEMLSLVIRIRSLEKAVQTWFVEAFDRDRGVVD